VWGRFKRIGMKMRKKAKNFRNGIKFVSTQKPQAETFYDGCFPSESKVEKVLELLTKAQGRYLESIKSNIISIGVGVAGTGKSYVALSYAAQLLQERKISKIIVTRPAVEAGEEFGFLPGELDEKYAPYIDPIKDILNKRLGTSFTAYLFKRKIIEARPLAFIRGSTFDNSFVVLDEAQNCTPTQMKMFLTRIGNDTKVVINGDIQQKDIKGASGLADAIVRLQSVKKVGIVNFEIDDIVRSGICKEIVRAYSV
jgi:phosphate starvation-inducible PhoH-like protein